MMRYFVIILLLGNITSILACSTPDVRPSGADCCGYWLHNQMTQTKEWYDQPEYAFRSDRAAEQFYRGIKPVILFNAPVREPVSLGHGWYYNDGGFHAALDYSRYPLRHGEDPTFPVYAVAAGQVVAVYWDDWFGNTIIIHHRGRAGEEYRSVYAHVRNGMQHDVLKARAIKIPEGETSTSRWHKYQKFAAKHQSNQKHWGTDAHKIKVNVGQTVRAGQLIAYAGNTGPSGAGNGLQVNGEPNDPIGANTHLHLFLATRHPQREDAWVFFDPTGSYGRVREGCYEPHVKTPYSRFF